MVTHQRAPKLMFTELNVSDAYFLESQLPSPGLDLDGEFGKLKTRFSVLPTRTCDLSGVPVCAAVGPDDRRTTTGIDPTTATGQDTAAGSGRRGGLGRRSRVTSGKAMLYKCAV